MIKLSNQQIAAIVKKIKQDIYAPSKEHNEKIRSSKEYMEFFDTDVDCKLFIDLHKKYDLNYSTYDLNQIRNNTFKDQFMSIPTITDSEIETEVVLATIDANDLETLIQTVSKKFK